MIPWFDLTSLNIGPIAIQVWGLLVSIGLIVGTMTVWYRAKPTEINTDMLMDIILYGIISGLIFSRLFHVFFYEPAYYLSSPIQILKIWQGGMSSYGSFVGAVLGVYIYLKLKRGDGRHNIVIADLLSFGALYGWLIGRLGCFMIHDHLGMKANVFFAIQTSDGPRLEMAFLEIILLLPLAVWFYTKRNKQMFAGWYLSVLLIYYGALRFILDFFRAKDIINADTRYLYLTPAQYFSIAAVFVGAYLYFKFRKNK